MKYKEIVKLSEKERTTKLKDLKMELAKSNASKTGSKASRIKKIIARIKTAENVKQEAKK